MATETTNRYRYTTWGSVRGMGPIRTTAEQAERDLTSDRRGCRRQGGYSDRSVYAIDDDGYVVELDEDGQPDSERNVYPYGRTSAALRAD